MCDLEDQIQPTQAFLQRPSTEHQQQNFHVETTSSPPPIYEEQLIAKTPLGPNYCDSTLVSSTPISRTCELGPAPGTGNGSSSFEEYSPISSYTRALNSSSNNTGNLNQNSSGNGTGSSHDWESSGSIGIGGSGEESGILTTTGIKSEVLDSGHYLPIFTVGRSSANLDLTSGGGGVPEMPIYKSWVSQPQQNHMINVHIDHVTQQHQQQQQQQHTSSSSHAVHFYFYIDGCYREPLKLLTLLGDIIIAYTAAVMYTVNLLGAGIIIISGWTLIEQTTQSSSSEMKSEISKQVKQSEKMRNLREFEGVDFTTPEDYVKRTKKLKETFPKFDKLEGNYKKVVIICSSVAIIAGFVQIIYSMFTLSSCSQKIKNRLKIWPGLHLLVFLVLLICVTVPLTFHPEHGEQIKMKDLLNSMESRFRKLTEKTPILQKFTYDQTAFYVVVVLNEAFLLISMISLVSAKSA